MKKLIPFLATLVAILVTYTSSAAVISAPPYDARIWAVHGPVKGSAAYAAWASNTVQYIYDHGTPPEALGFDYRLTLADITQFTGGSETTNQVIWYAVQVKARSSTNRFRASSLAFFGTSTDSQHYLTNSTSLDGANIVFGPPLFGITYNGAPRTSDTVRSTAGGAYVKDVDLDETIFIGEQWPHFTFSNETQWNAISNYVAGVPNFSIAGHWVLRGEGTNILMKVGKTLGMKASPMRPRVSMDAMSNHSTVTVGADTDPYVSAVLYSRPTLTGEWTTEGLVYGGQPQFYVFGQEGMGFFKVEPQ